MSKITHTDRPDLYRARLVDAALALQTDQGQQAAAAFLTSNGIGFAVIVRVLAEPERRRALDLPPRSP